ncbi:MAG: NACHT domain-containing protein [Cyanobacteria bacterium P01_F01_bin.53]
MTADNQSSESPKEQLPKAQLEQQLEQRSVSIGGSADGSTIVAGDGNRVYQGPVSYTTVFNAVDTGQFGAGQVDEVSVTSERSLSKQAYRWRQVLVEKVKHYWLEGVLERSLHHQVLIELGLEERSAAVRSAVDEVEEFLGEGDLTSQRAFPEGTQAGDVFHELGAGRTLLILGEPGSGKTTVLLKLVQGLIERLGDNLSQPIPVVLNLSSWSKKRQPIEAWLVQELYETFQISKALGERWIQEEQLILCLDGLDEVEARYRNECVQALNQFIQDHGLTEMVVCSRIRDYEALSERLSLRSAICVQTLTAEKIDQYLAQAGEQLSAIKTVLSQNNEIKAFASSPLILSVISLVYQGCDLADIPHSSDNGADNSIGVNRFRQQLFEAYIARMLRRHSNVAQPYSTEQIKHWLHWLAARMVHSSQSIFLIERLQPSWLPPGKRKFTYPLMIVLISVMLGIVFFAVIHTLLHGFPKGLINGAIMGMMAGFLASLITMYSDNIETVETLRWSWRKAKSACLRGWMYGLLFGVIFGLYNGVVFGLKLGLVTGLYAGLMMCATLVVISMAISGLTGGLRGPTIQRSVRPNQGIFRSAKNGYSVWVFSGLLIGMIFSLSHLKIGIANGLTYGLIGGLICGGWACWQHFNVRLLLYALGYTPWNYARFLDYAAERLFLQKVGGGYIFIHRMLLEHFAQMELE